MNNPVSILGIATHLPRLRIVHSYKNQAQAQRTLDKFEKAGIAGGRRTLVSAEGVLVQQWCGEGDTYAAIVTFVILPTANLPKEKEA